jgi:hypothetical protein
MHAYILWIAMLAYALHVVEEYMFDWKGWANAVLLFYPIAIWSYVGARSDGVLSLRVGLLSCLIGAALMAFPIVLLKLRLRPYFKQQ